MVSKYLASNIFRTWERVVGIILHILYFVELWHSEFLSLNKPKKNLPCYPTHLGVKYKAMQKKKMKKLQYKDLQKKIHKEKLKVH